MQCLMTVLAWSMQQTNNTGCKMIALHLILERSWLFILELLFHFKKYTELKPLNARLCSSSIVVVNPDRFIIWFPIWKNLTLSPVFFFFLVSFKLHLTIPTIVLFFLAAAASPPRCNSRPSLLHRVQLKKWQPISLFLLPIPIPFFSFASSTFFKVRLRIQSKHSAN